MTVDLSRDAIAARARAKAATGREGGFNGRELCKAAASALEEAKRQARIGLQRRKPGRSKKASDQADELLLQAAVQIRIAAMVPLDRPYLHVLDLHQIQQVRAEVQRAFERAPADLAVDTHRRIRDQRRRAAAERGA